jgi:carbamoyl-phosphate synthase large subunit
MTLILNNLAGQANEKRIGQYEDNVYMMKYNEVAIKRG